MTSIKITRKQYTENSSDLFHDYYLQFATEETRQFVASRIGIKKLLTCEDQKHLNGCVKWKNGGRTWVWDLSPINTSLLKDAGEIDSQCTRTCVGKAMAREMIKEAKAAMA